MKPEIFCQNCGNDYDFSAGYLQVAGQYENQTHQDCFITDLVSRDSSLIHHFQGMNTILIDENVAVLASPKRYLIYDL